MPKEQNMDFLHRALCADAGNGVQHDHQLDIVPWQHLRSDHFVIIICNLDVKEVFATMAANILLITIIAEALLRVIGELC